PPLLNDCNLGGNTSEIPPSGNMAILRPSCKYSYACLNALKDEILLERFTGISTVLKKNPVTGLSRSSFLPIKEKSVGQAFITAVMSRFEVWLAHIIYVLLQSIGRL